jgi:hypothetical protein
MGQRTSVYLDEDLQAAVKASGVPLAELIRRGLGAGQQPTGAVADNDNSTPAATPIGAIGHGGPSPGAICATPSCWQRDTTRYGLRQLPLCPSCRAALEGREHKREMPASAARLALRGAA